MFRVFILHLMTVLLFYFISSSVAPLKYTHRKLKMINTNKIAKSHGNGKQDKGPIDIQPPKIKLIKTLYSETYIVLQL